MNNTSAGSRDTDLTAIIRDLNIKDPNAKPYLTLEEWMGEAPTPPAGLSPQRRLTLLRAWATFWTVTQPPRQPWWFHPIINPGFRYTRGIWVWDTSYTVMGLSYGRAKAWQLGLWQIEVLLNGQLETGKIPREIYEDGPQHFGQHGVQAPGVLTAAANRLLEAACTDEEKAVVRKALEDFYPRFARNHEWFMTDTQADRGLCTWNGMDAGWDNSPRWTDGGAKEAVDLNCYLYLDRVELAKMARTLGREEDANAWQERAADFAALIRRFHYDPERGIFNDTRADGSVSVRLAPVIYHPLWVGIASREEAQEAVPLLSDPKVFGTAWPLPVVAAGDPAYEPDGRLWQGQVWVNINWQVIRGLQRMGFKEATEALRQKTLELIESKPLFWECYHPDTGAGLKTHNYAWTAACYIDLVMNPNAAATASGN